MASEIFELCATEMLGREVLWNSKAIGVNLAPALLDWAF